MVNYSPSFNMESSFLLCGLGALGPKGNVSQTTEEKIPWEGEFTIRSV